MLTTTAAFNSAISAAGREIYVRATVGAMVFDYNSIVSFSVEESVTNTDELQLGTAVSAMLDLEVNNNDGTVNGIIFEDAQLLLEFGIKTSSGIEYIPLGTFYIEKSPKKNKSYAIKAYDGMIRAEVPFIDNLTYPTTLRAIAQAACTQSGLTLYSTAFNNNGYVVSEPFYSDGATCRDVLAYVAGASGGFARCRRDGKIEIAWLTDTPVVILPDNYMSLSLKEMYVGPVNRLIISKNDGTVTGDHFSIEDQTSIDENGEYAVVIADNPILDGDMQSALDPIFNQINGLSYTPFGCTWQGNPALQPLDKILITNEIGSQFSTLITSQKLIYNGGLRSEIKAVGKSISARTYSREGPINKKIKNAEILLKKHDAQIQQKVSSDDVSSIIEQNPESVKVGFNGISDIIDMTVNGLEVKNSADASTVAHIGTRDLVDTAYFSRDSVAYGPIMSATSEQVQKNTPRYGTGVTGKGIYLDESFTNKISNYQTYAIKNTSGRMTVTPTTYLGWPALQVKFGPGDILEWTDPMNTTSGSQNVYLGCCISDSSKASLFDAIPYAAGNVNSPLGAAALVRKMYDNNTVGAWWRSPLGSICAGIKYNGSTDLTVYVYAPMLVDGGKHRPLAFGAGTKAIETFTIQNRHFNPKQGTLDIKARYQWMPARETPLNVRYIRDYLNGSTANTDNHWVEIEAYNYQGTNVAQGKTVTGSVAVRVGQSYSVITNGDNQGNANDNTTYAQSGTVGLQYVTVDLGSVYTDIGRIRVFHWWQDGRTYYSTKTQVSSDGVNWVTVFDSAASGHYQENGFGNEIYINAAPKPKLLFSLGEGSNVLQCYADNNGAFNLICGNDSGSNTVMIPAKNISSGFHIFTVRWNSSNAQMFIDGTLYLNINSPKLPNALGGDCFIGSDTWGSFTWGDVIEEVRVSSIYRTDVATYGALLSTNFVWDSNSTAIFDFNGNVNGTFRALGVSVPHTDGSYTLITPKGFEKMIKGTGRVYHSLVYTGEVSLTLPNSNVVQVTIALPEEFRGTVFQAIAVVSDFSAQLSGYFVSRVNSFVTEYYGTNSILIGASAENMYNSQPNTINGSTTNLTLSYIVIA